MAAPAHTPVLTAECIRLLDPRPGGRFIDCTVNGGGHSTEILRHTAPDGQLLGLDADPHAVALARQRLAVFGDRALVVHANFRFVDAAAAEHTFVDVDGILMDLGLSSLQLAARDRGFSFTRDEPLDMRFDPTRGDTAADYLATASREDIEATLRGFGEEPAARRISTAIMAARDEGGVRTTGDLVSIVQRSIRHHRGTLHPATRTFQALRIAVNDELEALRDALPRAVKLLRHGGRLAVISFHSLEDRIVKTVFRRLAGREPDNTPRGLPSLPARPAPEIRIVTPRPVRPSAAEVAANPRSRSARLRVAERL
jgi:16S rRNA (cytosine1402-N4)-methyltransferase